MFCLLVEGECHILRASARMVVGLSQLLARRRGTHCQHTFVVWRTAPLHLDDYLRLICFLSTSIYSALGVSAIMRYINRRFTYLLTYLLTTSSSSSNISSISSSSSSSLIWQIPRLNLLTLHPSSTPQNITLQEPYYKFCCKVLQKR